MVNYDQTINYLFSRLPMFSRIGSAAYKKDLTNTIAICGFLDHPENKFRSIHIAGTNGKGSVSHMLAAILQTAGYKTGLYTSPHLKDFRERIRINGEMIEKDFIIRFTERIKPLISEFEPSFFEITVAMAFEYFSVNRVDIAVIETGLGGRLDSTNVITPELSIITNIGLDHTNILGNSLEKIAHEKGGIIKRGVPVVVGEQVPETRAVFENIAKEKNATVVFAQDRWHVAGWRWDKHELVVEIAEEHKTDRQEYRLDLPGIYQARNLVTTIAACASLHEQGWATNEENSLKALRQVKKLTALHGRWEIIHHEPTIILDVAHNEDGMRQVVQQLEITDHERLHIILGMVKDKEIDKVLALLPRSADYYFTQTDIPRALDAEVLKEKASYLEINGKVYANVNKALSAALDHAGKKDLILVCGSVFLVGEVDAPMKKLYSLSK